MLVALAVTRDGYPLGHEVFAGNRTDVTMVGEVVTTMEGRYGRADRIWVMDRGRVSEEKVAWLKGGGRRYILEAPKATLRKFERRLVEGPWETVREGLEVQRWAATALVATEKHFRRLMGYKQLWILKSYLDGAQQVASARKVG